MIDNMTRWLEGVQGEITRRHMRGLLEPIFDRYTSQPLSSAGLVIKAGGGVLAKIGATAFVGIANGIPVSIAASTDMPALSGVITATYFNVFCFFVDSASVVTSAMGTEATTLAGVKFPAFPLGKCLVGFLIVTYASTFTGNSTALDTATTLYVSPTGPFDPSCLV